MKYFYLVMVLFIISCKSDVEKKNQQPLALSETSEGELEIYDFNGFEKFLNKNDDKIYVINFWATWCAPCVKELPYFEKLNALYKNKNVEVVLVSLDFPHLYESKLKPYIKDKELKSKVLALDDPDMNSWIPQVSQDWSGSIPATVIYNKDKRQFYEQSFTYSQLEEEVKQFLKQ